MPVVTSTQVIRKEAFPGVRVVVVGGSYIGVETARLLARQGSLSPEQLFHLSVNHAETPERLETLLNSSARQVWLVEKGPKIGFGYESGTAWPALGELGRLGVKMMKNTCVTAVEADGVRCRVTDKEGNVGEVFLPCDTVVTATGVDPDGLMAGKLVRMLLKGVSSVGNAAGLNRAIGAIRSGAEVGCSL